MEQDKIHGRLRVGPGMQRGRLAVVVCLVVASAGCLGGATGPLQPPSGPADERVGQDPGGSDTDGDGPETGGGTATAIDILDYDFVEGTAGNVVVELTVLNNASDSRTVRLEAAIEVEGSIEQSSKVVTLDPGQETFVGIQFEGAWDRFTPNLDYARAERV